MKINALLSIVSFLSSFVYSTFARAGDDLTSTVTAGDSANLWADVTMVRAGKRAQAECLLEKID